MEKRIAMVVLAVMVVAMLFTGCGGFSQDDLDAKYDEGYNAGYEEGTANLEEAAKAAYDAGWEAYADPNNPGPAIAELNTLVAEQAEEILDLKAQIERLTSVELKYDDGTADNFMSIGVEPGMGYLVDFTAPTTLFTITKILIFGKLYGSGYQNREFTVEIWDKNQKIIWSVSYPHAAKFTPNPTWVEIEVPEILVSGHFYAHVFTCSKHDEGGISIGYDSSIPNEHSEITKNWKVSARPWSFFTTPKEKFNWMIRVVGENR